MYLGEESQLFDEYSKIAKEIDTKINKGFSYRVLESLFNKMYKIKEKLHNASEDYSVVLNDINLA